MNWKFKKINNGPPSLVYCAYAWHTCKSTPGANRRPICLIVMASCSRCSDPLPELSCSPHQPSDFTFPKRSFGKPAIVWRSFQPSWFKQWPFLHYDEANDVAYCHTCVTGFKQGKMRVSNADPAFVSVYTK